MSFPSQIFVAKRKLTHFRKLVGTSEMKRRPCAKILLSGIILENSPFPAKKKREKETFLSLLPFLGIKMWEKRES